LPYVNFYYLDDEIKAVGCAVHVRTHNMSRKLAHLRPLGRLRHGKECNIKVEGVGHIYVVQIKNKRQPTVATVDDSIYYNSEKDRWTFI